MPVTALRRILRTTLVAAAAGALAFAVLPAQTAQAATVAYKIALLGDSWASGEGNSPYYDVNCDRSTTAWAYRVVLPDGHTVRSDITAGTASLQFLACQGAVTSNLTSTSEMVGNVSYPAQISAMNDNVTHVFLSISGNDLNFPGLLIGCMGNDPATCLANINSTRTNLFPGALSGLRSTIEKIYAKAPQAQIILTGYAAMVGNGSAWGTNSGYLNAFGDEFQDEQIAVVKSLQKKGIDVDFVDISNVFVTHAYGDTASSWFFAPQLQLQPLRLARSSLHPNGAGENAIAGEVSDVVEKPYTGSCSGNVKQGMTGNCVREIQAHYNGWAKSLSPDGPLISVDGDFGPATYAAVRRYQTAKNLTVDGIVGPATKKSLFNY